MPRKASENIILRQEQISLEGMTFNTMMKAVTTVLPEVRERERERERAGDKERGVIIYLSIHLHVHLESSLKIITFSRANTYK